MPTAHKPSLPAAIMASAGIVFGDIGTSPLYTLKQCLSVLPNGAPTQAGVMGFLSLIFWALTLIVTIKYAGFVMRADHDGEGGILTLMSLAQKTITGAAGKVILLAGLTGGAFFYGDGIITPAISVLSAIEGVEIIAPSLATYIIPASICILAALFLVQRNGTEKVSKIFGPIMLVWFGSLAVLGVRGIQINPTVLHALNPIYAFEFFRLYSSLSLAAIGMVVLAVTGAEALYADMGHIGKNPIRLAWLLIAMPALVINYFGQGALVLHNPDAVQNPFYLLAPDWAQIPLLIISTFATIIAAQAVISGVYTLTYQAIRQGFLPPTRVVFTSSREVGQIYIPVVNWILFSAVTVVVVVFKSSSALSSAYGIVVTGTMVLTACLLVIIARHKWRWPGFVTSLMLITMLAVDIPLFLANLGKLFSGGWIPVVLGLSMLAIMLIWYTERARLIHRLGNDPQRLQNLVNSLEESPPKRVKGTAIFLVRKPYEIPQSLLHNLKHNRVLHERVVFLHINTANAPRVANQQRLVIQKLSSSFWLVTASYGWQETPAMPEILHLCGLEGLIMKLNDTSVFTAHDTLVMKKRAGLRKLRGGIFLFLQRNALRTHEQFMIPVDNVIELGGQKEF